MVETLLVLVAGLNSVAIIIGYLSIKRLRDSISGTIDNLFAAMYKKDKDGNTQATLVIDSAAQIFASRVVQLLSATIKGNQSGVTRTVEGALEEEGAQVVNPAYGIAELFIPGALRKLAKNPLAMAGMNALIERMAKGSGGFSSSLGSRNSSGGNTQYRMDSL